MKINTSPLPILKGSDTWSEAAYQRGILNPCDTIHVAFPVCLKGSYISQKLHLIRSRRMEWKLDILPSSSRIKRHLLSISPASITCAHGLSSFPAVSLLFVLITLVHWGQDKTDISNSLRLHLDQTSRVWTVPFFPFFFLYFHPMTVFFSMLGTTGRANNSFRSRRQCHSRS